MKPWPHQEEISEQALSLLRQYALVYLAMEERTGKTLTGVLTVEKSAATSCLVVTKKKAMLDWNITLDKYQPDTKFDVINYHQVHKKKAADYDIVILDEAHSYISGFPKPSSLWRKVQVKCKDKPIIYMSATPCAQGRQLLFHQLQLSSWSPWSKFKNFYQWFKEYGFPYTIKINGIQVNQYDKADNERIWDEVKHLFITKTRKELGFDKEPEDEVHWIELSDETKKLYNRLLEHYIVDINGRELVCDTSPKLRAALHMIEGGTFKIGDYRGFIGNTERIDYIKETWGDTEDLVIMYNYKSEKRLLEKHFEHAHILQATSNAEGVDLSMIKHMVIYSQDWSTARHSQRRARQANKMRKEDIKVAFLLTKGATSAQIYKTVSINKKNFVDSTFERTKL